MKGMEKNSQLVIRHNKTRKETTTTIIQINGISEKN